MSLDNLTGQTIMGSLPWEQLADRILDYSLALRSGENFLVSTPRKPPGYRPFRQDFPIRGYFPAIYSFRKPPKPEGGHL